MLFVWFPLRIVSCVIATKQERAEKNEHQNYDQVLFLDE